MTIRATTLALVLLTFSGSAGALTYVTVADPVLTDQAELVARLEIGPPSVDRIDGRVMTHYPAKVLATVKGEAPGSRIALRVIGGADPERGLFLRIFGAPRMAEGERVLAFLRQRPDGSYRILHLLQGLFREVEHRGERLWVRGLAESDGVTFAARSGGVEVDVARHGGRFESWVRDRAAGRERPADYLVELPSRVRGDFVAAFTLIEGDLEEDGIENPMRWFEFDEGRRVVWKRHRSGQKGLRRNGKPALKKAVKSWNKEGDTPIKLRAGGRTSSTSLDCDGQNVVLFEDSAGIIEDPFDCRNGGVIAVAGPNCVFLQRLPWKGREHYPISDGILVTNANTDCFFEGSDERGEEVFNHELGHTLGIAHSCGDDESPRCKEGTVIAEASMAALVHDDGRGASLRFDDVLAARTLYDPDYDAAWCRNRIPGTRKFCRKCGPCGAAQGDCLNKDRLCMDGLECVKDVGEEFGYKPKADVCLPPDPG